MKKIDYRLTRVSKYGYGEIDVRDTYRKLPFQFFWTWLVGKALPNDKEPKHFTKLLLTTNQLILQLLWSWGIIIGSMYAAIVLDNIFVSILAMVLIVNRTRGLLHTFHYTQHGAGIKDTKLAMFLCEYVMSIPILHLTLDEYARIHNMDHHGKNTICTDADPDQQFMTNHGFRYGMGHFEFWFKIFFAAFHPLRMWEHIWFRFKHNFIIPSTKQIIIRIIFWAAVFGAVTYFDFWYYFLLYYLLPLLILTQFSSYIQHVSEHFWYPTKFPNVPSKVFYASLTWGRFLGRPVPSLELYPNVFVLLYKWVVWILKVLLVDLPIRLFSYMQDMSCHDYHHRRSNVNFWSIEQERANDEQKLSSYGPMTETWSWYESMCVIRDHLVYKKSDPFGLYEEYQIK